MNPLEKNRLIRVMKMVINILMIVLVVLCLVLTIDMVIIFGVEKNIHRIMGGNISIVRIAISLSISLAEIGILESFN